MQLENLNPNLLIKLLTGVIYYDEPFWQELINNKLSVMEYFVPLGLDLSINESNGFAFLKQRESDSKDETPNRIVKRHPLNFEVSLLLVILREELEVFDSRGTDETELYLSNIDLKELIEVYFRDKKDEVRLLRELDRYINAVVKLGFLKQVSNSSNDVVYKVMPIIKARVNPDFLDEFKRRLSEYITSL